MGRNEPSVSQKGKRFPDAYVVFRPGGLRGALFYDKSHFPSPRYRPPFSKMGATFSGHGIVIWPGVIHDGWDMLVCWIILADWIILVRWLGLLGWITLVVCVIAVDMIG